MSKSGISPGAPHVYVVVLNWNGWQHTIECLESAFQLKYPSFTVIVCDNGSTDDSLPRLRSWFAGQLEASVVGNPLSMPLRTVRAAIPHFELEGRAAERGSVRHDDAARAVLIDIGENRGFAGGNNVALRYLLTRHAGGYVWLLNNDMVVAPDSLDCLMQVASDTRIGGVGGTLLEYASPNVIQAAAGGRFVFWQGLSKLAAAGEARSSHGGTAADIDYISMGCLLVPLDAVRRVGLIDERYFMYGEDVDYSLRLRAAGYRLGYAPAAEVWHKGSASSVRRSAGHDYNVLRSALLLVDKFHPRLLPLTIVYLLYRSVLPKIVRGQWDRLGVVMSAFRDFMREPRLGVPESQASAIRSAGP